ncbi:MAG: radical SAM protein [Candidatus Omnitrophica bacterium]|jgi:organic radical activating enzyme|nr:radical SAM protein [Candidatus Omnitrophota bacterium]
MKIFNIRKGFNCNSSSTHSIIMAEDEQLDIRESQFFTFGWENFILSSEESKMRYLLAMVYYNLDIQEDNEAELEQQQQYINIFKEIFQEDYMQKYFNETDNKHYVFRNLNSEYKFYPILDHQSAKHLPRDQYTDRLNIQYLKELKEFLKNPKIIICGGNDNIDDDTAADNTPIGKHLWFFNNTDKAKYVVRDEISNAWIAIDRKQGDRFIFTFDDSDESPDDDSEIKTINKTSFPLSVDLKITNYCTKNCSFCYQNSSKYGTFAPYDIIKKWIDLLVEAKVMEVTFGGGEPTTHPDFIKIIDYAKSKNIIQSFTTSNIDWFLNTKDIKQVMNQINSFAFTPASLEDITRILAFIYLYGIDIPVYFNLVENIHRDNLNGYKKYIKTIKDHYWDYNKNLIVNLLGFKNTNEKTAKYEDLSSNKKEMLQALMFAQDNNIRIGIDTSFAAKYQDILNILNIPTVSYFKEEGKFSMYIDAVEGKLGKSSYTDEYIDFNPNKQNVEKFLNIYRTF